MEKFPTREEAVEKGSSSFEKKNRAWESAKKKLRILATVGMMSVPWAGWAGLETLKALDCMEPDEYIELVEKDRELNEEEERDLAEKLNYLVDEYDTRVLKILERSSEKAKESKEGEAPEIEGFEIFGISNKDLGDLWNEENYPKGTLKGNIEKIKFVVASEKISSYGYYHGEAEAAGKAESSTNELTLMGSSETLEESEKKIKGNLDWHFSHELGHLNDWDAAQNLSLEERAEFLYEVTQALNKPDSFRDALGYLDSFKGSGAGFKYKKTSEYWGILCEYYFTFPEILAEHAKEYTLVEKWIKRMDKDFDPVKARDRRKETLKEL